jgi:hypothetical protein
VLSLAGPAVSRSRGQRRSGSGSRRPTHALVLLGFRGFTRVRAESGLGSAPRTAREPVDLGRQHNAGRLSMVWAGAGLARVLAGIALSCGDWSRNNSLEAVSFSDFRPGRSQTLLGGRAEGLAVRICGIRTVGITKFPAHREKATEAKISERQQPPPAPRAQNNSVSCGEKRPATATLEPTALIGPTSLPRVLRLKNL